MSKQLVYLTVDFITEGDIMDSLTKWGGLLDSVVSSMMQTVKCHLSLLIVKLILCVSMCTCVLRAANVGLSSCNSKGMHICYRCTCCTYVSAESLTPSYTCKMDQDYHADHTVHGHR